MNINFENLDLLPEIKELLIKNSSPYLSKKELSLYLKVSQSFIKNSIHNGDFILGKHFFKIGKAKIIFDRVEIDKWLRAKGDDNGESFCQEQKNLSQYISQWTEDYKINRSK